MFQKRYCVHAQFKVKSSDARVRSVACDELENYIYEKLLSGHETCVLPHLCNYFYFLSNELVWRKKKDDVSIFNHFVTMYCLVTLSVLSKTVSSN